MFTLQIEAVVINENGEEVRVEHQTGGSGPLEDQLVSCAMVALREWLLIQVQKEKSLSKPLAVTKITTIMDSTYRCDHEENKKFFSLL